MRPQDKPLSRRGASCGCAFVNVPPGRADVILRAEAAGAVWAKKLPQCLRTPRVALTGSGRPGDDRWARHGLSDRTSTQIVQVPGRCPLTSPRPPAPPLGVSSSRLHSPIRPARREEGGEKSRQAGAIGPGAIVAKCGCSAFMHGLSSVLPYGPQRIVSSRRRPMVGLYSVMYHLAWPSQSTTLDPPLCLSDTLLGQVAEPVHQVRLGGWM